MLWIKLSIIPWGYRDSWAWKDTAAANVSGGFSEVYCTDGSTTIQTSNCPFPPVLPLVTYNVTLEVNTASIYQNGGSVGPNECSRCGFEG